MVYHVIWNRASARVCYYHQKAARKSISHGKPLELGFNPFLPCQFGIWHPFSTPTIHDYLALQRLGAAMTTEFLMQKRYCSAVY